MADIYEKLIHEDEVKCLQIRLVVNEFRGVEYLSFRRYYLDFDGEWLPSHEGVSMPLDLNNCREMFKGLVEILSLAESKEVLKEVFGNTLEQIYV